MNTNSVECKVFPDSKSACKHGWGGIVYEWKGDSRNFPEDVAGVLINMPVDWGGEDNKGKGVMIGWNVDKDRLEESHRWVLSGTYEKPTLNPSLHWITMWHGFLENGYLRSC